jgi:hypothetical protein
MAVADDEGVPGRQVRVQDSLLVGEDGREADIAIGQPGHPLVAGRCADDRLHAGREGGPRGPVVLVHRSGVDAEAAQHLVVELRLDRTEGDPAVVGGPVAAVEVAAAVQGVRPAGTTAVAGTAVSKRVSRIDASTTWPRPDLPRSLSAARTPMTASMALG